MNIHKDLVAQLALIKYTGEISHVA